MSENFPGLMAQVDVAKREAETLQAKIKDEDQLRKLRAILNQMSKSEEKINISEAKYNLASYREISALYKQLSEFIDKQ